MRIKVFLEPHFNKPDKGDGGIRRMIDAQLKYLPDYGVQIVTDKAKADLIAGHGAIDNAVDGLPFVSHSHGLYWSEYKWDDWAHGTNEAVINALVKADAITVPSEWVRLAYTRGLFKDITRVYHGVDAAEWKHDEENDGYVLWNKPRHDSVSNADDVAILARSMPNTIFAATIAQAKLPNLRRIGVMPYTEHKKTIQKAGVYLATARETFGIGTLEALASGVPVAGWRFGGQEEIIIEGETGYLAEPGNYEQLAECVNKCLTERARMSPYCIADAKARWNWESKIEQYAKLYERILTQHRASPKVSVIVTCHNLARFLNAAIDSVEKQTLKDWECIIVDDASTDQTPNVSNSWVELDKRIQYHKTPTNLKLSGARNFGFTKSRGKYIINLDADDELAPDALATLAAALDNDKEIHVAYGGLDLMDEDGGNVRQNPFPMQFDWLKQMAHLNQLSYAAMMRREVMYHTGGYKERMWRAEDGEFWCRASSFGYRIRKVTEQTTLLYRLRSDSKSMQERRRFADVDGNWCADFPWAIASSGAEGKQIVAHQNFVIPHKELIPFGAPRLSGERWKISHRQNPQVSVIIPVGKGHERIVIDALDSLIAQTFGDWEAVVINDTDAPMTIPGAPYARIIDTESAQGAGVARNRGIQAARAPLVLFLDADDTLEPTAIEKMVKRYAQGDAGYVYTDWTMIHADGKQEPGRAAEPSQTAHLTRGQHAVTVLMATADAVKVGGFDEAMIGWEDNDFFIKCAINGICGAHIPEPLLVYRDFTGSRRVAAKRQGTELEKLLHTRYAEYIEGGKELMGCCGGRKGAARAAQYMGAANVNAQGVPQAEGASHPEYVRMEFTGAQLGTIPYTVNGHIYYGANTDENRFVMALWNDVPKLERLGIWRKAAEQPIPEAPAKQDEPQVETITAANNVVTVAEKVAPPAAEILEPAPAPVKETPTKKYEYKKRRKVVA